MVVVQMPEAATFEGGKAEPMLGPPMPRSAMVALVIGVVLPFLALLASIPVAWGWGLSWRDLGIGLGAYLISGFGTTVGFHRYFTHGSLKPARWLRVALAVADSLWLLGKPAGPTSCTGPAPTAPP